MNYLRLALDESVNSIGTSRPNPAVGAVVVKDGIVVGKGRTQRPGSAHAEVMALRDAGELARGASIYVTLEPCCHYGRTPPCTKAIIDAGIKKVFFAHADPNPVVRGNSRKILEEAGIEVHEGLEACIAAEVDDDWDDNFGADPCGECHCLGIESQPRADQCHPCDLNCHPRESEDLAVPSSSWSEAIGSTDEQASGRYVFHDIERYFEGYDYYVRNKRTFVEVKCAVSEEGYMGAVALDGSHLPVRITGENANCWNHELRAISDAVLVGAGTLLSDNPSLNVRLVPGNDPVKVLWAGHHEFTAEEISRLKVFDSLSRSRDLDCHPRESEDLADFSSENSRLPLIFSCVPQPSLSRLEVILLTHETFAENWSEMLDNLSARGMHRLMVEPGAGLASQLFHAAGLARINPSEGANPAQSSSAPHTVSLWNRLDFWRSTDCRIDEVIAELASSGNIKQGLDFPELPKNIVAKESFMAGPDVLTVYYPAD